MSRVDLSDEQLLVINCPHPRFIVTASAGSGKTTVLVERYLHHVLDEKINPRRVLAITFTNRAASEMRNRILKEFRNRGLNELAEQAEIGSIGTIDGFCERTLRENALEAAIDPRFETLEGADFVLLEKASLDSTLEIASGGGDQGVRDLLSHLAGQRKKSYGDKAPVEDPNSVLATEIKDLLGKFRSSLFTPGQLRSEYASGAQVLKRWHTELIPSDAAADAAEVLQMHAGTLEFHPLLKRFNPRRGRPSDTNIEHGRELEAASFTAALLRLVADVWERLDHSMARVQRFDFTAQAQMVLRLLQQSEVTKQRFREAIEVVMVDEAQDLNPLQFELLNSLGSPQLMLVGDAQQSIFAFRHAEVEQFLEARTQLPHLTLTANYRSQPGILRFVDQYASHVWGSEYRPMAPLDAQPNFDGVAIWEATKDSEVSVIAQQTAHLIKGGVPEGDIAVLISTWALAKSISAALNRLGVANRVLGGRTEFYTLMEIRDVSNCLRALVDPMDRFSLIAVLRSPLGGISIDGIVQLALRSEPLYEVLLEVELLLEADRAALARFMSWFTPLRETARRIAAWEVLGELIAKSGYLEALARRPRADETVVNVRKLLAMAAAAPHLGAEELAEQIRDIERLEHADSNVVLSENDEKAVKILTVHTAKGLEFPVTIVAENFREIKPPFGTRINVRRGLVAAQFGGGKLPIHGAMDAAAVARDAGEARRKLYVAFTRAQRALFVTANTRRSSVQTSSSDVAHAFDLSAQPQVRIVPRNQLDQKEGSR